MIVYPAEYDRRKDTIFASVAAAGGGGRRLPTIPLSLRDFPETAQRVETALARAKRKPSGAAGAALKRLLIRAQYNGARRYFAARPGSVAMCWNGLTGSRMAFMLAAKDAGAPRLFVELSPLPGRITLDAQGMNAENSLPRDPAFYLGWARGRADLADWRALGNEMAARAPRRADVAQSRPAEGAALSGQPFLFVPLQVPGDSQIMLFADWVRDLPGFIAALCRASAQLPAGWHLRIKEHPSARASLAGPLKDAVTAARGRIVIDNATDTFAQVRASRGVVTINSSVGLQAFFFDKPVIVTGRAFFNLPGLVTTVQTETGLANALSGADRLGFDAGLRDAFMTYLVQSYYPSLSAAGEVDPAAVARKLAEARALATGSRAATRTA